MGVNVNLHSVTKATATDLGHDCWAVVIDDDRHSSVNIFCTEAQARAVAAAFSPTAASLATMQPLLDTLAKAGA